MPLSKPNGWTSQKLLTLGGKSRSARDDDGRVSARRFMTRWRRCLPGLLFGGALTLAPAVSSGAIETASLVVDVFVQIDGDSPVSFSAPVTACAGTGENRIFFARRRHPTGRRVLLNNLPAARAFILTVAAPGHKSVSRPVTLAVDAITRVRVILRRGAAGRGCDDPPRLAARTRPLVVGFHINNDAAETDSREIMLTHVVSGDPDSYRASERRDMKDASWLRYVEAPLYRLAARGPRQRSVYFQIRRGARVSAIVRDSIVLVPPRQTVALPLTQVHARAAANGWTFSARPANPVSTCRISVAQAGLTMTTRQRDAGVDGVCRFVLFGGAHRLKAGWRYAAHGSRRTRADRCRFRFFAVPESDGARLTYKLTVIERERPAAAGDHALGRGCRYVITGITLRGPAGADWRDAFRR